MGRSASTRRVVLRRSRTRTSPPPARVAIERVTPCIDGGAAPIKRVVGEAVVVEADVLAEGHDQLAGVLRYRREAETRWHDVPLVPLVNDRWRAAFTVTELGRYRYAVQAWVDRFGSWRRDLEKRLAAGQDVALDLRVGAALLREAAGRLRGAARRTLSQAAGRLEGEGPMEERIRTALDEGLAARMAGAADRRAAATSEPELIVVVDRERARFSAWYELFPRSTSPDPHRAGTFKDCEARLAYVAELGFDVVYFPPIHPIGVTHRKGKNNVVTCQPGDPGSPWAIGDATGGHKAVARELGTLQDFRRLVETARRLGLEVALDMAFQCSPDHPYVQAHPEWFRWRPDGTVQYAENPPKKYEDIYPFEFDTPAWRALWDELKSLFDFWVGQGVRIFRVDNPHTKPFAFWAWVIPALKATYPDLILLSEAFTRPKIMHRLAKLGFTQSYTYFAWRNTKWELTQYFTELTQTEAREYFRPHLWPNTPDILTQYLQSGGRPAFMARFVLAATLGASYGIYGPAFELCVNAAREPGSEEYLCSEKYEVKHWDLGRPESLKPLIARVNWIRRENPALQQDHRLHFHGTDHEELIAYSKASADGANVILTVVNLDPHHTQSGWVSLDLEVLGVSGSQPFQLHDLLTDARYVWHGPRNYVELNPQRVPAHIFRVRRHVRHEQEFGTF